MAKGGCEVSFRFYGRRNKKHRLSVTGLDQYGGRSQSDHRQRNTESKILK